MQDLCTAVIFGVTINAGRYARHPALHIHAYAAAPLGPAEANRPLDRKKQVRRNGLDDQPAQTL
jgi:hypothetical protein